MITDDSDEALALRAKTEAEAFGLLYERYVSNIYSYIYRRTGNAAEAEDLTAKVFFSALRHMESYQPRGVPFSAWLFRIAHNLVANWYRDNQRRRTVVLDEITEPMLDSSPDEPTHLAEKNEECERLMDAVRRLSGERQKLLVLKFATEMTNAQIGAIMGRSEGAVKALLHRTIESLRRILDDMDRPQLGRPTHQAWVRAALRLPPAEGEEHREGEGEA